MVGVVQIVLLVVGMHLLALACAAVLIIHAMQAGPTVAPRGSQGGSDDGPGNDRWRPPRRPRLPGGGIPLPDAEPARVRVRDHRPRLAPARERRGGREPVPAPTREPARQ